MRDLNDTQTIIERVTSEMGHAYRPQFMRRHYHVGERVKYHDAVRYEVGVIGQGALAVVAHTVDKESVILDILMRGEIVGDMPILDGLPTMTEFFALVNTTIHYTDRRSFEEWVKQDREFNQSLLRVLSLRVRRGDARFQTMAPDSKRRVLKHLRLLAEVYGELQPDHRLRLPFPLTNRHLASMVCLRPQVVRRVMLELLKENHITYDEEGSHIIVDLKIDTQ